MSYKRYHKEMRESISVRMIGGEEAVTVIQREASVGINTLYPKRDYSMNQKGLLATTKYKNANELRSRETSLWLFLKQ